MLNHGGVEMGQGLYVKVAQVAASELSVDLDRVRITATRTDKVPNTSATAASVGLGHQRHGGARRLRRAARAPGALSLREPQRRRRRRSSGCRTGCASARSEMAWEELAKAAYLARVPLSATGFYATPKIHWDRAAARGRPFYYFAYGAAVSRGRHRHADGREPAAARRHPARCRPVAEPGDRPRPGRGRLRPGRRLADDRGALVGRRGAAAHARAVDLQDPLRLGPAAGHATSRSGTGA